MACSTASDSNENKPDFCIHISGEGSCQIKKMVCPAASDSTKIKLECKELCIDIPAKMARPAAADIIEDIFTRRAASGLNEFKELLIEIPQDMKPARLPKSCIFKVPEKLRDVNKKAYNPKLISIGPLHHGQEELKEMELQKLKYFEEFFGRKIVTPEYLASTIQINEEEIRHCYAADTSKFISKEFINMILLDAIFIIELFLRNFAWSKDSNKALHDLVASAVPSACDKPKDADDYMFSDKWLRYHLRLDLLLLENQLPFFILKELWEKIMSNCCEGQQNDDPTGKDAKLCKNSNCHSVGSDHHTEQEKSADPTEKHATEDTCFLAKLWEKCNCYRKEEQQKDDPTEKRDTSFLTLAFAYFYELHPEHEQKPPSPRKKKSTDSHAALGCFSRGATTSVEAAKSCMGIEHPLTDLRRCINSGKKFKDVKHHFTYFRKYGEKVKHFTDMLRYFFYSPSEEKKADGKCTEPSKKFTCEFRTYFCFCSDDESEDGGFIKHLYSATQLDEAGVKFKRVKHRPLLDIKFKKNLCLKFCPFLNCSWLLNCLPCFACFKIMQPFLEVPTFEVNDETECVFRNLMAFEQCSPPDDSYPYICNYILLLDRFINSKEDVDLLVDENVIVNFLGSNKRVATLVNDLCLEIVEPERSQYMDLSDRLNKHYGSCWNKNMAKLSRKYFGDFWRGTATVVGLTVLVFTLWNFHRLLFRPPKGFKHQE